jgi:hypothetical protein
LKELPKLKLSLCDIGGNFYRKALLEKGLISEIPKCEFDLEEKTFEPIEVLGKPLSETIIEERD